MANINYRVFFESSASSPLIPSLLLDKGESIFLKRRDYFKIEKKREEKRENGKEEKQKSSWLLYVNFWIGVRLNFRSKGMMS